MTTRQLIEEAFADVPYPGDDDIADHEPCLECDEIRAFFRGKSWRDLKFPELHQFHESLPLFNSRAFHYFLPGYMVATLGHLEEAEMIPYGIMAIGGYTDDAESVKNEARESRKMFSNKQREVIAGWLRELYQRGPEEWRDDEKINYAIEQILND